VPLKNEYLNSDNRSPWNTRWSARVSWRVVFLIVGLCILLQVAFPAGRWHWLSYLSYGPVGVIVSLFGGHVWRTVDERTTRPDPQTAAIQPQTEEKAGS
jgi:hypothetical protein